MYIQRLQMAAPIVLRLALAAVFAWFGVTQLMNPGAWVGMVPDWATAFSGMPADTIVSLNGVFEVAASALLAAGFLVRWVALVLAAHLFVITTSIGLTPTGIRDFGLSFATLAIALYGNDGWSFSPQLASDSAD